MVLDFLNNVAKFSDSNYTSIVVPKKKNLFAPTYFRPIILYNILYKLISKVYSNRLKGELDSLINPNQRTFVPGRMIFDNMMVAYETIHTMRNHCVRKKVIWLSSLIWKKPTTGWSANICKKLFELWVFQIDGFIWFFSVFQQWFIWSLLISSSMVLFVPLVGFGKGVP